MSYSNATFHVDDGSESGTPGSDAARLDLVGCTVSNPPSSVITRVNCVGHGLSTGAVVDLTGFDSWLNEPWKVTVFDADNFDLDGATWQATVDTSGTATPRGGSSWTDAWETISSGATSARIQPGDTIKVAKSGDPISIGGAQWTDGPIGAEVDISSSTDATPIVITTSSSHGLNDGDYIRVYDHQTNIAANGTWRVANSTPNTFELVDAETGTNSVGSGGGGGSDGKVRQINAQVVYLDTAQTITVDNCESNWSLVGGFISAISVTDPGTGYTVGDILTISTGPGDATAEVLSVDPTGPVASVSVGLGGNGYAVNDILTLNAGNSDATVEVTSVGTVGPVLFVAINNGGSGYNASDILTLITESGDATVQVLSVDPMTQAVTDAIVLSGGTAYTAGTTSGVTGGAGLNCTFDITDVLDGDVLAITLISGGTGYTVGVSSTTDTTGPAGTGCTVNITAVNDNGVLSVQLDMQSTLGGYSAGSGQTTTNPGPGTNCTLDLSVLSSGVLTLEDSLGAQSPQSAYHIHYDLSDSLLGGLAARLAYKTISLTDFSSYDSITLWAKTFESLLVDEFILCLCSDTDGAVIVDTFKIPAIQREQKWHPLVIPKDLGGNLGSSIQSIALYSGVSVQPTSQIYIDNVSACNSSGLNLHKLITKNSAAVGGSEYRYAIESINGRVVMLAGKAGDSNYKPDGPAAIRGYKGVTENVTTYIRKPIVLIGTGPNELNKDGTHTAPIMYSGGWSTSDVQDGLTIYDGHIGQGNGISCSKKFNNIENFETTRYRNGAGFDTGAYTNNFVDFTSTHCFESGISLYQCWNNTFSGLRQNYCGEGVSINFGVDNVIENVETSNCNAGLSFSSCVNNKFETVAVTNCNFGAVFNATNPQKNKIQVGSFSDCIVGIQVFSGHNHGRDLTFTNCLYGDIFPYPADNNMAYISRFDSKRHNGTGQNHLFDYCVNVVSAPTTRGGGAGLMWGTTLTDPFSPNWVSRDAAFPFYFSLAYVPVEANLLVTISLWMQKTHATDIEASLICKGGQIAGVNSDVETAKASDTNWENVTITFTPTERGVVEIGTKTWLTGGAPQTVYVDDITINQAV